MRFRRNLIYTRLLSHPVSIILMTCCFFDETAASRNPQYEACKQEICGNVSFSYPFWTKSHLCGLSGFEVGCNGGHPFFNLIFDLYLISESVHYDQQFVQLKGDGPDPPCLPDFRYSETPPPSTSPENTEPGLIYLERGVSNLSAEVHFFYHCNLTSSLPYALPFNCSENAFHQAYVALIPLPGQEPQGPVTMKSACRYHYFVKVALETSDFNRVTKTIDYKKFYNDKFTLHWTDMTSEECRPCQSSGGECGQSGEDVFQCFCSDHQDPKSCTADGRRTGLSLGLPFGIGGTALLLLSTVGFLCWIRRGRRPMICKGQYDKNDRDIENFIKSYESFKPKRYSYSSIKKMTNSFREKLGQGGFGAVYKGELPNGTLVAVKLLNSSKGDGQEFINEVASISRTSHVNVVSLLGFCFEGRRRALIYEYMSNGSLDKFIYDDSRNLGWERLYHIAVGIARGLEYLHRGCSTRILHFDIKPQNILLDRDFCPKISDFGLSKLCLGRESVVSMLVARGTIGYIAPEVVSSNFGGVSHKSDAYSYGMMLIEMIGGRKILDARADRSSEVYFHDQVYRLVEQWHEPGLAPGQVSTPDQNEIARKMAFVGLWCIQGDPSVRPSMSRVIEMLEGSTESLQIPPKPFLFTPAISRPVECSSSISQGSSSTS